jgi:hypothetical protein
MKRIGFYVILLLVLFSFTLGCARKAYRQKPPSRIEKEEKKTDESKNFKSEEPKRIILASLNIPKRPAV